MAAAISEVENQVQNQLKSVGVVGGGQLAWMMADGAKALGLELLVQTPNADDPACAIAHRTFIGGVADAVVTAKMAQYCDVITFENEFIDLPALRQLTDSDRLFLPSARLPRAAIRQIRPASVLRFNRVALAPFCDPPEQG